MKFVLKPYNYNHNISTDELIDDLKKVAKKLEKETIMTDEYN